MSKRGVCYMCVLHRSDDTMSCAPTDGTKWDNHPPLTFPYILTKLYPHMIRLHA